MSPMVILCCLPSQELRKQKWWGVTSANLNGHLLSFVVEFCGTISEFSKDFQHFEILGPYFWTGSVSLWRHCGLNDPNIIQILTFFSKVLMIEHYGTFSEFFKDLKKIEILGPYFRTGTMVLWRHLIQETPGNSSERSEGLIFIHQSELTCDLFIFCPNFISSKHQMVQKWSILGQWAPFLAPVRGVAGNPKFENCSESSRKVPFLDQSR